MIARGEFHEFLSQVHGLLLEKAENNGIRWLIKDPEKIFRKAGVPSFVLGELLRTGALKPHIQTNGTGRHSVWYELTEKFEIAEEETVPRVGLYIDYDNLRIELKSQGLYFSPKAVINAARQFGSVVEAMMFRDLDMRIHPSLFTDDGVKEALKKLKHHVEGETRLRQRAHKAGLMVIDNPRLNGPRGNATKDTVDDAIKDHVYRTLFTRPDISVYVIGSADQNFLPLINAIRNEGKKVVSLSALNPSGISKFADENVCLAPPLFRGLASVREAGAVSSLEQWFELENRYPALFKVVIEVIVRLSLANAPRAAAMKTFVNVLHNKSDLLRQEIPEKSGMQFLMDFLFENSVIRGTGGNQFELNPEHPLVAQLANRNAPQL